MEFSFFSFFGLTWIGLGHTWCWVTVHNMHDSHYWSLILNALSMVLDYSDSALIIEYIIFVIYIFQIKTYLGFITVGGVNTYRTLPLSSLHMHIRCEGSWYLFTSEEQLVLLFDLLHDLDIHLQDT